MRSTSSRLASSLRYDHAFAGILEPELDSIGHHIIECGILLTVLADLEIALAAARFCEVTQNVS